MTLPPGDNRDPFPNTAGMHPGPVTGHILPQGRYLHPPSDNASSNLYDLPDSASDSVRSNNNSNNNTNTGSEYDRLEMHESRYQRLRLN